MTAYSCIYWLFHRIYYDTQNHKHKIPVVTYDCETWVLKENIKTKLRVFERKVLRRIYGPTKEKDGVWRIESNEELKRLTGDKNINYIKAQRLAWFGHVERMPNNNMVKKIYVWSAALTSSLGRPKNRWKDDVKCDITRMKIANWKSCIRNRTKWKKFVEMAKTSLKLYRLKKKKKKKLTSSSACESPARSPCC